jgi:hypothetical protein
MIEPCPYLSRLVSLSMACAGTYAVARLSRVKWLFLRFCSCPGVRRLFLAQPMRNRAGGGFGVSAGALGSKRTRNLRFSAIFLNFS